MAVSRNKKAISDIVKKVKAISGEERMTIIKSKGSTLVQVPIKVFYELFPDYEVGWEESVLTKREDGVLYIAYTEEEC